MRLIQESKKKEDCYELHWIGIVQRGVVCALAFHVDTQWLVYFDA